MAEEAWTTLMVPVVGVVQATQTQHSIWIQVSPLCSGLMPPPFSFTYNLRIIIWYNLIATKEIEWDCLTIGEVYGRLLVEFGQLATETNLWQLEVFVASCIIGVRTFAHSLQFRYEQFISSPLASSAQGLVSGLVDNASLHSFQDMKTINYHCILACGWRFCWVVCGRWIELSCPEQSSFPTDQMGHIYINEYCFLLFLKLIFWCYRCLVLMLTFQTFLVLIRIFGQWLISSDIVCFCIVCWLYNLIYITLCSHWANGVRCFERFVVPHLSCFYTTRIDICVAYCLLLLCIFWSGVEPSGFWTRLSDRTWPDCRTGSSGRVVGPSGYWYQTCLWNINYESGPVNFQGHWVAWKRIHPELSWDIGGDYMLAQNVSLALNIGLDMSPISNKDHWP